MDRRLHPAPVVEEFASRLAAAMATDVVGVYAGGSLASGDYHPGVSDLDLVGVLSAPLAIEQRETLRRLHQDLRRDRGDAAKLHCAYLVVGDVDAMGAPHLGWVAGRLVERPLTAIARQELLDGGIVVCGPPPASWLAPVDREALHQAVRDELTGYWSQAIARPWWWLHDWCVDLGILTLTRAEVALHEDRLITKHEALDRLARFQVPQGLIDDIASRRDGTAVILHPRERLHQAWTARRLVARGIRTLT